MNRLVISLSIAMFAITAEAKEYHLFYLGGQSNMDGYGFVKELPESLSKPIADVMIFHGNQSPDQQPVDGRGLWSPLQTGHGVGFSSDGKSNQYSERFGVELTFALALKKKMPDVNIALIKYSRGGTSIAEEAARQFGCWEPDFNQGTGDGRGINQYDHFLATIRHATSHSDIDGDGEPDTLIPSGIVWMQGESDAGTEAVAVRYHANLKRLVDLIRAALRTDDLPTVIGRISDSGRDGKNKVWEFGDTVRQQQAEFVEADGNAALVTSTDQYGYSDPWHYDTAGYIDLGEEFGKAMAELVQR